MLTEMERATNRNTPWETVTPYSEVDPTPEGTFAVRNPYTGVMVASGLQQLQQAGYIISDLKNYGEIQPQHNYSQEA